MASDGVSQAASDAAGQPTVAPDRLGWPVKAGYASGGVSGGVAMMVPSVLLLYFATQSLGLPLALGSIVILTPKIAIVLLDPLIGRASDALRSPWGRRAPFLAVGAVASSVLFAWLFSIQRQADQTSTFLMLLLAYLGASVTFSLFGVPFTAMPPEMTADATERARIVGWRVAAVFLGMLLGAAGAPLLVAKLGGGVQGYGRMGLVLAPLLIATSTPTVLTAFRFRDRGQTRVQVQASGERGFGGGLLAIARFAPFTITLSLNVLGLAGMSAFMAAAPYFVEFGLGRPVQDVAPILLAQIGTAFLSMIAWGRVVPRLGFFGALITALVMAGCGALLLALGAHGRLGWPGVLAGAAGFGAGVGGLQVTGLAALAEAIRRFNARTGLRREGLMTGFWTAAERIAYALGPALVSVTLGAGGFETAKARDALTPAALEACRLAMTAGPVCLFAAAALLAIASPAYRALSRP